MKDINIAITAASYSGNKGAAAMLQSSLSQLYDIYGERLDVRLMSVYPSSDKEQVPFDFVKIVSQKPAQLVFLAFPCAIFYRLFRWFPPLKKLISKNKIINTYLKTDLVIDEAGISFVDSRGFVMNTYAFICMAVPLLVGTPVVKYSQALGTFKNPWNRFCAKMILPKLKLICARGSITYDNLRSIGIEENVRICADGAFTMPDDSCAAELVKKECESSSFWNGDVVGVSVSSVVDKKCRSLGIDYRDVMTKFIDYLTESGKNVMIIANAARTESVKPRNNDLVVCDDVYGRVSRKDKVLWIHKEMTPEEIREYIGRCDCLVASRFHAMIGALQRKVPVLLVGWSHKYQEVLDMFGLGKYATDFSGLDLDNLIKAYENFASDLHGIKEKIDASYDSVMKSSKDNIRYISRIIDEISDKKKPVKGLDTGNPEKYIGNYISLKKGYALSDDVRACASSGGLVTALLLDMLENKDIDGAWVTKTAFENGKLTTRSYVATTAEEIMDAGSSVYIDIPQMKYLDEMDAFDGKLAVVLIPCMLRAFDKLLERRPSLKEKVVFRIGLYCSGTPTVEAAKLSLKKAHISSENAKRLYFRRGHWRGNSCVIYEDGSEKSFSYKSLMCAYKNAYYYALPKCMSCKDHFGEYSDISFGDVWLKEMKKNPIKHTGCVIRSTRALECMKRMQQSKKVFLAHMSAEDMIRSQKRALVFKYLCDGSDGHIKWNHKLCRRLALRNMNRSVRKPQSVERIPQPVLFLYMCFMRFLLSF